MRVTLEIQGQVVTIPHGQAPLAHIGSAESRIVESEDGAEVWELVLAPLGPIGAQATGLRDVAVAWDFSVAVPESVRAGLEPLDGALRRLRPGAYALLTRRTPEPEILLTHLRWQPGWWTLPGGGLDPGESPREAASREVHEETGLDFVPGDLLGMHSHRYVGHAPDGVLEDFQLLALVYTGRVDEAAAPRVTEVDGSTDEAAWVPIAGLADLNLTPLARAIIEIWGPSGVPVPDPGRRERTAPARRPT